jgi:hypothetical protein
MSQTRPTRHREASEHRSFASTSSASDLRHAWGAFHMDELEAGVSAICGRGTNIPQAAERIKSSLLRPTAQTCAAPASSVSNQMVRSQVGYRDAPPSIATSAPVM